MERRGFLRLASCGAIAVATSLVLGRQTVSAAYVVDSEKCNGCEDSAFPPVRPTQSRSRTTRPRSTPTNAPIAAPAKWLARPGRSLLRAEKGQASRLDLLSSCHPTGVSAAFAG